MSVEDIWRVRTRLLLGTPYRCSVPRHLGMSIVMSRSIERSKNMRLRVTQDSVDMLYSLWTVLPRDGATQPGRIRQGCLTAKLRARHVSLDAARRHLTRRLIGFRNSVPVTLSQHVVAEFHSTSRTAARITFPPRHRAPFCVVTALERLLLVNGQPNKTFAVLFCETRPRQQMPRPPCHRSTSLQATCGGESISC
jgi:hypothetical protein